ncbi:MAG: amidohydrolase family protein [Saprospiraceae bacterium]|nr:amidohydrolase family protein [Saprospiraceae bacterium]
MKKTILALLGLIILIPAMTGQKTYEFKNGQWFNGTDFVQGTWYVVGGNLTRKAPAKIDSVVNLDGRWVVPPVGDANVGSVAGNPTAPQVLKSYREEGVFYLQTLSNSKMGREAVQNDVNRSGEPDATFANGGITCTFGQPFTRYEGPAQGLKTPKMIAERYEVLKTIDHTLLGDAYWFIDNKTALDQNWEKIKAQKPAVITIYLLDVNKNGGKEGFGLSEDVAKAVVKKAHKSDLRVFAYVLNADDVRTGIKIGVDGFANLPGNNWDGNGDTKAFELSEDDLKKMAKKKTVVIPLFSHAQGAANRTAVQEYQGKTLRRLVEAGVPVAIGSDDPQRTMRNELNYWYQLGSLSNLQIMRILCETTPKAIFPKRKIGKLDEGYEASFLVLSDNPLQNILKIRVIAMKMKNGQMVK